LGSIINSSLKINYTKQIVQISHGNPVIRQDKTHQKLIINLVNVKKIKQEGSVANRFGFDDKIINTI